MKAPARIGIVGSGSVGIYYGARLVRSGADVRFLMRGDLEAVRARGSLLVEEGSETWEARPVQAFATPKEMGKVDLVLVALKTTSGADMKALLGPLLGPETAILTIQNGLGADEALAGLFGAERILGGLVFMALTRVAPGRVRCFHAGLITLGEFGGGESKRASAVASLLTAAGMRAQVVPNLLESRWRKLVWNVPFNGLTIAEGGITTDKVCSDPRLAAEARALMVEIQRAAAAFGFAIPDTFVDRQFEITPPMGAYQPSSLVDFLAGREVEVETIWGEPLRRAQGRGVAMPRLEDLYLRLKKACRG